MLEKSTAGEPEKFGANEKRKQSSKRNSTFER